MNLPESAAFAAVISGVLPLGASLIRGRSKLLVLASALTAVSTAGFFLVLFKLSSPGTDSARWAGLLLASATPLLISGYFFSIVLGRDHPNRAFRSSRQMFVLVGSVGIAFFALIRHPLMLSGVEAVAGEARIILGPLGKAYLSYLLIGIVLTGYNLEGTYRTVSSHSRQHLRLPFLGLFAILAFMTYTLTLGLLYSALTTDKLLAVSAPVILGNFIVAYGFLRGSLIDASATVSRNIVYSSFTALAAGLYVFAVGIVAQLSSFTKWSPDEVVSLSLAFLIILMAAFLLVSNRFQRRVRRFIDRNFYVNRYDYRAQWSRVTRTMEKARGQDRVLEETSSLLKDILTASAITISLKEETSGAIRPIMGKGAGNGDLLLKPEDPLYEHLSTEQHSLLMDRRPDDFEYIAIYAENMDWLDSTASQVIAPLMVGENLVGTVGLQRHPNSDPFSFEDVAMTDSIVTHVSAALHSAQLSEELAESREMELISNWSSMLLHDLKNYLSPLRMISENLVSRADKPEIHEIVSRDINRIADHMESKVHALSDLRQKPLARLDFVDLNALVDEVLGDMNMEHYRQIQVSKTLRATRGVKGDPQLLKRLVENLVMNAVEAMNGHGKLEVRVEDRTLDNGNSDLMITIADDGPGMPEEFIGTRLFRPFATTKRNGMGLGMYQCRSIVRAHQGSIEVDSKIGAGTRFLIRFRAMPTADATRKEFPVSATEGAMMS